MLKTKLTALAIAAVGVVAMIAPNLAAAAPASPTTPCSFTRNLTIGVSGADVTCLQQSLLAGGFSIPAGATGYFGVQTQAAVASWQAANGVAPAAGYFGPISQAHWNLSASVSPVAANGCAAGDLFSPTTGVSCISTSTVPGCVAGALFSSTTGQSCSTTTTTTGTTLTGNGYLSNLTSLGNVTSNIHEGDNVTSVVGESADAVGGDVAIQRVDATFTVGTSDPLASVNLNRYVSQISLWLNSTEIATVDPATADKDSGTRQWTVRFSNLNNAVIKNGTTGNLYVKVTPVTSVGQHEDGDTINVDLGADAIRATGADGISDTYGVDVNQDFSVSSAITGTLTVSTASDNPNASNVEVGSSTTTGVKLLSFNLQAKNEAVQVTDLPIALYSSANLSNVVATVYLEQGNNVLSSKTVTGTSTANVTFTNINQTISANSTENFTIVADIQGDSSYPDGTVIGASTLTTGWDTSDSNGATISPSSAAVGNPIALSATGISVSLGNTSATDSNCSYLGCSDVGNYSIPFTVTAGDNDLFIAATVQGSVSPATNAITFTTTQSSTPGAVGPFTADLAVAPQVGGSNQGDVAGVAYRVPANTSRTFTLNVSAQAVSSGFTGIELTGIGYGTSASLGSTFTSNITTFKTNDINLVQH